MADHQKIAPRHCPNCGRPVGGATCEHCGWNLLPEYVEGDLLDVHFAENMTRLREAAGISQAQMVQKLRERGWTNVHPTTISRIEKGERPVRLGEAAHIATVLGQEPFSMLISPDWADQLFEVREQHRSLRHMREQLLYDVQSLYGEADSLARTLAADENALKLLPQDELREMVKDVKRGAALGRKLLADLGQPAPEFGDIFHTRLGKISIDFDGALRILTKEAGL